MKNYSELTLKQQKFIDYYLQSGNATKAAIEAGYSRKTARGIRFREPRKVRCDDKATYADALK